MDDGVKRGGRRGRVLSGRLLRSRCLLLLIEKLLRRVLQRKLISRAAEEG